jgi:hypothetical protein
MPNTVDLKANVETAEDTITAMIRDQRAESVEAFDALTPAQRAQLAVDAWAIGLRALRNARAEAQESHLSDIGEKLKVDLGSALTIMVQQHQERVETALRRYFDPTDGELARRLERFVEDDGELPRLLQRFAAPDGGLIAETLALHVGEQSALLRRLNPTATDGIVQTLKQVCTTAVSDSQTAMQQALDPLKAGSPVARLLVALRQELKKAESDRSKQMITAFKALDANDPNSLLSNLARQSKTASESLLSAMNPANDKSPLAHLRNSLGELLERHAKTSRELLEEQRGRQVVFEKDLRETVARIETQRAANRASPRGGADFEDRVLAAVRHRLGAGPYVCTKTGNVAGIRDTCRVGDFIVRFTDESAWAGASIVFECKHDQSYSVDKAIKELDVARANRDASVGVFVMAQSHASADFPDLSRIGHNILVSWDPDDAGANYRLDAAVMLAMTLASRKRQVTDHASTDAVRDIENLLANQAAHVEKMRKASDGIRKHNDAIRKELDKAENELRTLVGKAQETLRALDLNAGSESAEREEPIEFEGGNDSSQVA